MNIGLTDLDFWLLSNKWTDDTYCSYSNVSSEYTEITFEQFKKYVLKQDDMKEKKIIGYKCPMKLEGDNITIPIGGLFKKKKTSRNYHYEHCFHYELPKEIVEQWEPVYEEEFKVGDLVTDDDGKNVYEIYQIDKDGKIRVKVEGGYGIPQNSLLRKATPEEIEKAQNIILYFGDVNCTLNKLKKLYETEYGIITFDQIVKAIEYIENPPSLSTYKLTIHNQRQGSYQSIDKCEHIGLNIGFGCKSGTMEQLYKLRDTLKENI